MGSPLLTTKFSNNKVVIVRIRDKAIYDNTSLISKLLSVAGLTKSETIYSIRSLNSSKTGQPKFTIEFALADHRLALMKVRAKLAKKFNIIVEFPSSELIH